MERELNIRLATGSDTEQINALYARSYKKERSAELFDWEFNSAPAGKAIYVVAESGGEIVGTQCVIPYYIITHDNKTVLSGKSEDTLVSPAHRGRDIFEKMYRLLVEECRKAGIQFVWGFTYATKPFKKIGFEIPFMVNMGVLVLKPLKAAGYLASLSSKNKLLDKAKISGLAFLSWAKAGLQTPGHQSQLKIERESTPLNSAEFNYLQEHGSFGLKLDESFLAYRIYNNPYSKSYATLTYPAGNKPEISMIYHISQGVAYIVNLYVSAAADHKTFRSFFGAFLKQAELATCHIIRFWGMPSNAQNKKEMQLLSDCGFTFIKRGIHFVWLKTGDVKLDPQKFVLSRLASQGTD